VYSMTIQEAPSCSTTSWIVTTPRVVQSRRGPRLLHGPRDQRGTVGSGQVPDDIGHIISRHQTNTYL
jgi:hypothetical protein